MERTACVDIRALPLQLLLRAHPEWKARPAVVVDRDKPQGIILWANRLAYSRRIVPGMRYAVGLSLAGELCGGAVEKNEVDNAVAQIAQRLWAFSPRIEPSTREAGVFWLDVSGLGFIYPSLEAWADCVREDLRSVALGAVVAVGFSRFGSYALARAGTKTTVLHDPAQERALVRDVPLSRLGMAPALLTTLSKLGIDSLGGFIDLPPVGIVRRFGPEAGELHRLARGEGWAPLDPARLREPVETCLALDYPESDVERLMAVMAGALQSLLAELSQRHEKLAVLHLSLTLDDGKVHSEEISPATPTRDAHQILTLCRLRLETLALASGVVGVKVQAEGTAIAEHQDDLFPEISTRNVEAAERAFAKIRAEFGNDSVVIARLHAGQLPEAQFAWEPLQHLELSRGLEPARHGGMSLAPVIRRIFTPPIPLPTRDRHEPDGWLVAGVGEGPVEEVIGPHVVSGGWWLREAARTYYYVRTRSGRWLWIYHDQMRRRWFLQGEVQ